MNLKHIHNTHSKIVRSSKQIPIVGMVVTISPSFNLYRIVVLPAASRPTIRILISFFAKSIFANLDIAKPISVPNNQENRKIKLGTSYFKLSKFTHLKNLIEDASGDTQKMHCFLFLLVFN